MQTQRPKAEQSPRQSADAREVGARRKRVTFWWAVSIVLHVAIVAALVLFTPLRQWLFEPARTTTEHVDQAEVDAATEALFELYHHRMRTHQDRLSTIRSELQELVQRKGDALVELDKRRDWITLVDATPPPVATSAEVAPDADLIRQFGAIVGMEGDVMAQFERIREYELCEAQQIPLSRAVEVMRLAVPERRSPSPHHLTRDRYRLADGTFDALKAELASMHTEASRIVSASQRILDRAKGIVGDLPEQMTVTWGMETELPELAGGGGDLEPGRPYRGAILLPNEAVASTGQGLDLDIGESLRFGNKLGPNSMQGNWMSIPSWWTIGPFSHPGRDRPDQLDRVYPPEATIDLDAQYVGKMGQRLQWQYMQTNYVRVEPLARTNSNYAIWYFYTEIYSDREQELLVSFGSDDYSVAWLARPGEENGQVIYRSGKDPQPWRKFGPDCFRKVRFGKGHNRLLVKLENAGGTTGFSVLINLDPAAARGPLPQ